MKKIKKGSGLSTNNWQFYIRRLIAGFFISIAYILSIFLIPAFFAIFQIDYFLIDNEILSYIITYALYIVIFGGIGVIFFRYKSVVKSFVIGLLLALCINIPYVYFASQPFNTIPFLVPMMISMIITLFLLPKDEQVIPIHQRILSHKLTYVVLPIIILLTVTVRFIVHQKQQEFISSCKNLAGKTLTIDNLRTIKGRIWIAPYPNNYLPITTNATSYIQQHQDGFDIMHHLGEEGWRCSIQLDPQTKTIKTKSYYWSE